MIGKRNGLCILFSANIQPLVNLNIQFIDENSDIIISLSEIGVSYSSVGTDARMHTKQGDHSLNLGWLDEPNYHAIFTNENGKIIFQKEQGNPSITFPDGTTINITPQRGNGNLGGTVIHEFCHALGMEHEQQNPNLQNYLIWNYEQIWNDYCSSQGWDWDTIYNNVLEHLTTKIVYTKFDPKSIMIYPINPEETFNLIKPITGNQSLSDLDKKWLQKMYPKVNKDETENVRDEYLMKKYSLSKSNLKSLKYSNYSI